MSATSRDWPFALGESPFHTRGVVYSAAVDYIEQTTEGGFADVRREFDDELARFFEQRFDDDAWYDTYPIVLLVAMAARHTGLLGEEWTLERARLRAERDIRGLKAFIVRWMPPSFVAERFVRIARRYFDWGTTEVRRVGPGRILARRGKVPRALAGWHSSAVLGYLERALERRDRQNARATLEELRPDGSAHGVPTVSVILDIRWDP